MWQRNLWIIAGHQALCDISLQGTCHTTFTWLRPPEPSALLLTVVSSRTPSLIDKMLLRDMDWIILSIIALYPGAQPSAQQSLSVEWINKQKDSIEEVDFELRPWKWGRICQKEDEVGERSIGVPGIQGLATKTGSRQMPPGMGREKVILDQRHLGWNQHIKSLVCQDLFLEVTANLQISVNKT